MGITGQWAGQRNSYVGPLKWGTGINPVHASRDAGRGKVVGIRENLLPLGEGGDEVIGPDVIGAIDWLPELYDEAQYSEAQPYVMNRPAWGVSTETFRDEVSSRAMGDQVPWGPYYPQSDDFPLSGPTGGTLVNDRGYGENVEREHPINVPTAPVTGGWLNKARGALAAPESAQDIPDQPGFQPTINTVKFQGPGVQSYGNDRSVARGADDPRQAIVSRTAGQKIKEYAKSFRQGGGHGVPDMYPYQLTAGLRRPWYGRTAATPPLEIHTWNELEGRSPLVRSMPSDPYQGSPEYGGQDTPTTYADWGY